MTCSGVAFTLWSAIHLQSRLVWCESLRLRFEFRRKWGGVALWKVIYRWYWSREWESSEEFGSYFGVNYRRTGTRRQWDNEKIVARVGTWSIYIMSFVHNRVFLKWFIIKVSLEESGPSILEKVFQESECKFGFWTHTAYRWQQIPVKLTTGSKKYSAKKNDSCKRRSRWPIHCTVFQLQGKKSVDILYKFRHMNQQWRLQNQRWYC